MKRVLPGFIILGLLATLQLWSGAERAVVRAPASVWSGCAQAFRNVMASNTSLFGFLKKMPLPQRAKLDIEAVEAATLRFSEELAQGRNLDEFVPETMEETLGLIEAVLRSRGFTPVDYAKMDVLKRGKLANLLKQLDKPSRFSLESYENIWAEIFVTRLGRWERFKSIFDGEHAKRQALALLMQEEVARLGLAKAGKKYALLEDPEGSVRRFRNSTLGKTLATAIFNAPVALGMPPLVLPRFSRVRLPRELAESLLDHGLTEVNLSKVDDFLMEYSAGRFGISLGTRERYELIRRSYVSGIGVYFLVLASWEAVVRHRQLSEQEDAVTDGITEVQDLLDKAETLEAQGYDIFEDSAPTAAATPTLSRECRDLRDCLQSSVGDPPWDISSSAYKECQDFVDPKKKCESLAQ